MRAGLTHAAASDLTAILRQTYRRFGATQSFVYAGLIDRARDLIGQDPERPSVRVHDELQPGLRSFSLRAIARRRRSAIHVLWFVAVRSAGLEDVLVLRILHERMDPVRRMGRPPDQNP